MSLKEFYNGKTILLTGATGFLGKVVLEKICRSLPVVKTIYVAVKAKVSSIPTYKYLMLRLTDSKSLHARRTYFYSC